MDGIQWDQAARRFCEEEIERLRDPQGEAERITAIMHTHSTLEGVLRGYLSHECGVAEASNPQEVNLPELLASLRSIQPDVISEQELARLRAYNRLRNSVAHSKATPVASQVRDFVELAEVVLHRLLEAEAPRSGLSGVVRMGQQEILRRTGRTSPGPPGIIQTLLMGMVSGVLWLAAVPFVLALIAVMIFCTWYGVTGLGFESPLVGGIVGLIIGAVAVGLIVVPTGEEIALLLALGIVGAISGLLTSIVALLVSGLASLFHDSWWDDSRGLVMCLSVSTCSACWGYLVLRIGLELNASSPVPLDLASRIGLIAGGLGGGLLLAGTIEVGRWQEA